MDNLKVAYVLLRFPCITETFVAAEIQKIQDTGVEVCIYSLLPPREKLVHPVSLNLLPLVRYVPSIIKPALWAAQFHYLRKDPGQYFRLLGNLLRQPAPGVSFYLKRTDIFLKSLWIARDLESRHVQLIHSHFAWLSAASAWVVGELLNLPFTATTHAYDIYSDRNDLLELISRHASKVITISQNNKHAILEKCSDLVESKIKVIHCGIDLSFFKTGERNQTAISLPLHIISVGSLIPKKGHEYLILACELLKQQGVGFQCTIVGVGSLEKQLQTLINKKKLDQQVKLVGAQSQVWVRNQLSQSDVFALACVKAGSEGQDGIPVAMMEALAMGLPVISTPVSGIPELIKDEVTGLLVPERNPGRLARAIIRVMEDASLRKTLNVGGLQLVAREYDITQNVKELRDQFSIAIEESNPSL